MVTRSPVKKKQYKYGSVIIQVGIANQKIDIQRLETHFGYPQTQALVLYKWV